MAACSLILIEQAEQLLVLVFQVLDGAFLLRVFLHEQRGFPLELLVDRQVLPAICQTVVLLLLLEEVVLLLNEDLEAHLLHLVLEFIVLDLQVLNVRILHGELADLIRNLLLLLHQLFFVVFFDALNFLLLRGNFELRLSELGHQVVVASVVGKLLVSSLALGLQLDDFCLFVDLVVFVLSFDFFELISCLVELLLQVLQC